MNLILCGPPFVGKSTIGKELAKHLGRDFIDTDKLLEAFYGMPCSELFKLGDVAFRQKENEALKTLLNTSDHVIALGGGTLTYAPNVSLVKALGFLVYLTVPFPVLLERLLASGRSPTYLDPNDLSGSYQKLIEKRRPLYETNADFTLDTFNKDPKECALTIITEFEKISERHHG